MTNAEKEAIVDDATYWLEKSMHYIEMAIQRLDEIDCDAKYAGDGWMQWENLVDKLASIAEDARLDLDTVVCDLVDAKDDMPMEEEEEAE